MVVLSEHCEQVLVINWCHQHRDDRLKLIYAHLNGLWARNKSVAVKAKAAGAKAGIPDLFLPVPIGNYHGLYIEMKKTIGSSTAPAQKQWLLKLAEQGYFTCVCKGAEMAKTAIENYLSGGE